MFSQATGTGKLRSGASATDIFFLMDAFVVGRIRTKKKEQQSGERKEEK
jgi:hypothetical protein